MVLKSERKMHDEEVDNDGDAYVNRGKNKGRGKEIDEGKSAEMERDKGRRKESTGEEVN